MVPEVDNDDWNLNADKNNIDKRFVNINVSD